MIGQELFGKYLYGRAVGTYPLTSGNLIKDTNCLVRKH